ncbi:MAG: site-specific integrase [Clostridiales bacterium]|nr:site-specific integrase [Clostridiales bacterium]
MKFIDWQKKWLEIYERPRIKHHTYVIYNELFDRHINPFFCNAKLEKIKSDDVQCFLHQKMQNGNVKNNTGLSPSTVNLLRALLNSMFECAFQNGFINQNPCKKIKRVVEEEKPAKVFSRDEQKRIEEVCMTNIPKYIGVLIVLYTGVRLGELLALTWEDVDLKNGIISINKTVYYAKDENGRYQRYVGTPKSKSSKRIIPIAKNLKKLLKEHKKSAKANSVIFTRNQSTCSVRGYQQMFAYLQKKANIRQKNFHTLRHTFATRAIECGVDIKTLSELMGHKNATMTLNRYGHSLFETKQKAVDLIAKKL